MQSIKKYETESRDKIDHAENMPLLFPFVTAHRSLATRPPAHKGGLPLGKFTLYEQSSWISVLSLDVWPRAWVCLCVLISVCAVKML